MNANVGYAIADDAATGVENVGGGQKQAVVAAQGAAVGQGAGGGEVEVGGGDQGTIRLEFEAVAASEVDHGDEHYWRRINFVHKGTSDDQEYP